nr:4-hydroxybenzoate octaprenyltransferase [Beijerinckia indica]
MEGGTEPFGSPIGAAAVLPDAAPDQWLFRFSPPAAHPYLQLARLDRPVGWWLLLLPCWWGSALASLAAGVPLHWAHLLLFLIGAIVMRGAGSTFNDIVDREVDAKVERTRMRPLPSGRVSVLGAQGFFLLQSLIGLAVLLSFNLFTIVLGLSSLVFVAIYPFMKRVTSWPQAVLGCAFAWGILMGWAAAFGSLSLAPVQLYLGGIAWTIGYDTIYAIQDIRDDVKAGVKSTARLFGTRIRLCVGLLYGLTLLLSAGALWVAGALHGLALIGWIGFALHLGWQVKSIDLENVGQALRLFRSNRDAGLLFFIGLAAQSILST